MRTGWKMMSVWFGSMMILIVAVGAFAFAFTDFMNDRLYGTKRVFFVFLLVAYAVYRAFRLYSVLKNKER